MDEAELLDRAAKHGVTLEDGPDGRCTVLGIGGGLRYTSREHALSYVEDWLRRANAFERSSPPVC
jgi:hypothetical protein